MKLDSGLKKLAKNYPKPDLAVIILGSDPYEHDELKSTEALKLTLKQLLVRDKLINKFLDEKKIPQAYVMSGGYGKKSWQVYTQFLEWILLKKIKKDHY